MDEPLSNLGTVRVGCAPAPWTYHRLWRLSGRFLTSASEAVSTDNVGVNAVLGRHAVEQIGVQAHAVLQSVDAGFDCRRTPGLVW
jgi:hypothetical protein